MYINACVILFGGSAPYHKLVEYIDSGMLLFLAYDNYSGITAAQ